MKTMKAAHWAAGALVAVSGVLIVNAVMKNAAAQRESRRLRARALATNALTLALHAAGRGAMAISFEAGTGRNAWFDSSSGSIGIDLDWAADTIAGLCADEACADDFALAVLAHELGHALDPWLHVTSSWSRELRADALAGRVLALLGASPEPFVRWLLQQPARGSDTHPPAQLRVEVVSASYLAMPVSPGANVAA